MPPPETRRRGIKCHRHSSPYSRVRPNDTFAAVVIFVDSHLSGFSNCEGPHSYYSRVSLISTATAVHASSLADVPATVMEDAPGSVGSIVDAAVVVQWQVYESSLRCLQIFGVNSLASMIVVQEQCTKDTMQTAPGELRLGDTEKDAFLQCRSAKCEEKKALSKSKRKCYCRGRKLLVSAISEEEERSELWMLSWSDVRLVWSWSGLVWSSKMLRSQQCLVVAPGNRQPAKCSTDLL